MGRGGKGNANLKFCFGCKCQCRVCSYILRALVFVQIVFSSLNVFVVVRGASGEGGGGGGVAG